MFKFLCGHTFSFLLGKHLKVEILGHVVTVCLTFEELLNYFAKWLRHLVVSAAVYEVSNFSKSLPTISIICLFDYGHPNDCEVTFH